MNYLVYRNGDNKNIAYFSDMEDARNFCYSHNITLTDPQTSEENWYYYKQLAK